MAHRRPSIRDIATWVTRQETPSFFDTESSVQTKTLANFSVGDSKQSYQVVIKKDFSSGLSIEFQPELSGGSLGQAPLSVDGNTFIHFDPDRMTMDQADLLIKEALETFKALSQEGSFLEPTGQEAGDHNTLESLDASNAHSGQVPDYKADADRMLDYAVESMTQRDKLDQITSTLIKNRYERYRLNRDTRPKDGLAEFEGLIRADLHSRNINWVEQWRAVTDLASAIVAVEAPHDRKVRLTRGLSQALFKTPTTGEHPANDVIGSSDAQKDPGSVSGA